MNSKNIKQRNSHSQTPNKKASFPIQLSQYFSRRNTNPCGIGINNKNKQNQTIAYDNSNKQNHSLNVMYANPKQIIKDKKIVNKTKKVIHLKSNNKNSRSYKGQKSAGSTQKRIPSEFAYVETQVAAFDQNNMSSHKSQNFYQNSDSNVLNSPHHETTYPVIIQLDLYRHKKSIQDTLASSAGAKTTLYHQSKAPKINNVDTISSLDSNYHSQSSKIYCCQHYGKPATFLLKNNGYCDKCAANLITKGQSPLLRIKNHSSMPQENQQEQGTSQRQRNMNLNNFIEQIDRVQPKIERLSVQLEQYQSKLISYYDSQSQNIQSFYSKAMFSLNSLKKQLLQQLVNQQKSSFQFLQQIYQKFSIQLNSLKFMRNDIVQNINQIVCPNIVQTLKFEKVFLSFKQQLKEILTSFKQIQQTSILLPEIYFSQYKFQQQIRRCWNVNYKSQEVYLFNGKDKTTNSSQKKRINLFEDQNCFRLSFGKQIQKVQSPTFKAI